MIRKGIDPGSFVQGPSRVSTFSIRYSEFNVQSATFTWQKVRNATQTMKRAVGFEDRKLNDLSWTVDEHCISVSVADASGTATAIVNSQVLTGLTSESPLTPTIRQLAYLTPT
jgi:hypothetical protein